MRLGSTRCFSAKAAIRRWGSRLLFLLCLYLLAKASAATDGVTGRWRVTNDLGITSVVELYESDGLLHGRMLQILGKDGSALAPVCSACPGELAGKPVVGMTFITGLHRQGEKWIGGKVVDIRPGPLQGVTADCEIALAGKRLRLFGYLKLRFLGGVSYWDRDVDLP